MGLIFKRRSASESAAKPFRDELLSIERLEERALSLGASLTIEQGMFGDQHPRVLESLENLATVLEAEGRSAEAEACRRRAPSRRRGPPSRQRWAARSLPEDYLRLSEPDNLDQHRSELERQK